MESGLGALAGLGANNPKEWPYGPSQGVSEEIGSTSGLLILFGIVTIWYAMDRVNQRKKKKAVERMEKSKRDDPRMFEKYHLPLSQMKRQEPWEQFSEKDD